MTQTDTYVMYVPYETCMISKPKSCYISNTSNKLNGGQCCHFHSTLCLSEMSVKQDRFRLGCQAWVCGRSLSSLSLANQRPVTNHIHDCHMMNIQSMMSNTKNGHRSTAPSVYQTHHSFYKIFQYFELYSSEPIPKLVCKQEMKLC